MKKTIFLLSAFIMTLISTAQVNVTTLAGSTRGFSDNTGFAAQFNGPNGVTTDAAGNVYVADLNNFKIRKITPAGVVSTFAGSTQGFADGTGTAAQFNNPRGVATDAAGNVYVADTYNHKIRKITPAGVVTTMAGSTQGFADGNGAAAMFSTPFALTTDAADNVYVADTGNYKIRKITPEGVVSTLAGSTLGFADGNGTTAKFHKPTGVAIDAAGNVYVADLINDKIRKITPSSVVSTLAGSTTGYTDGTVASAQFHSPYGVATDAAGNVYVSDGGNNKIRKITPEGVVSTLAGSTVGFADGTGTAAQFNYPTGVAIDATGNLYVADFNNHKIRKITQQLGVGQNEVASKITIYPNPAQTFLNVQVANNLTLDKIIITDLNGKTIKVQTQNTNTINVENLAQGTYILEAYSGEEKYSSKFLKE